METSINSAILIDAGDVLRSSIIVARLKLDQGHLIRGVAVYLIRAHVDEDALRSKTASGLEHIERTYCVDLEINERKFASQIVGGLSRAVYHHIKRGRFENTANRVTVTYVYTVMRKCPSGVV
jgi:hypothetical protein